MLRFRTAELTHEVEADSGFYQRILVRYRPDKDGVPIIVQQHGDSNRYLVDAVSIEWVESSDEGAVPAQVSIAGRTLNAKGQPDGRQTEGSAWVSSVDAASIDKITDAWVTTVVTLPTAPLTVDAKIVRDVLEGRNQRAVDEAERVMAARAARQEGSVST